MKASLLLRILLTVLALNMLAACGGSSSNTKEPITQPEPEPEQQPEPEPEGEPESEPEGEPDPEPEPEPDPEPEPEPDPEPEPEGEPQPEPQAPPAGGVSIIDTNPNNASFWAGSNNGDVGSRAVIDVDHPEFSQATRITVSNPASDYWNGQLSFPLNASVAAGDVVLVRLFMRSVENTYESGASFTTVFIEDNIDFTKFLNREITAAQDWVEYYLPAEITDNHATGEVGLRIGFGAGPRAQVFDIGGVDLLHYTNTDISAMPSTRPSYEGREPDAAWRTAAAERIEQHRKGDFELTVVDDGNPIANATIDVDFQKHAYHFGSVTVGHLLMGTSEDSAIYREKVLELFNQSGPENDLKWGPWEGEWGSNFNQTQTLNGLQWLRDNGLYTRGHVMVWPSKRNLPNLMQQYLPEGDPANANPEAKQVVLDHIDDIATATANYLDEWDVLNEPYDNHYLMDAFGDSVMVDWFNRARINLPTHGLYINDYSILSAGGRNFAHQEHYTNTIQYLVDNNAPITGIGLQSHFGDSPTAITRIYEIIDQYSTAFPQLDIRATEFDVSTTDEDLQADFTRDFLTIFFSHPKTVGVQLWGFWANAHWYPNAALYDADWREKPNALAWKEQIFNEWWNDFDGTTNAQGKFDERGFYGDYQVTVTVGEEQQIFTFSLVKGGEQNFSFEWQ